ncbi:MAG: ATPase [Methanosphaera sp. rholeuAM6]|nr:MAG: ATPase [Methanosphaera sp. rholeuAM6]
MADIIGRCYGETEPHKVAFISKKTPAVNEYVYLEYNGRTVMGIIDTLLRGSFTLSDDLLDEDAIGKIVDIEGMSDQYIRGEVTILGDINTLEIPRTPAPIGTPIIRATIDQLDQLFHNNEGIKIGTVLSQPEVDVKLDVNKMVSRHLGILAMTGAGKSNATSVIIDELLLLGGTILVFDMHSEYGKTKFNNGSKKSIDAKINPRYLNIHEYKRLARIPDSATNQERYLREAYDYAKKLDKNGKCSSFIDSMIFYANSKANEFGEEGNKNKSHEDAARQVEFKLDDMKRIYHSILDKTDVDDIVNILEVGKVNIISLSSLDEIATDIIVNHVLSEILRRRKNARTTGEEPTLDFPIFNIIEEAHILASQRRDTRSKKTISRIAREGRKFGVGLCLVSQSPKSLDSESLSQLNNLIILRLVEPSDQAHVQKSSESLSEDLLKKLPSLNVGEAVVLGQMTKVPTLVKIDEFKGTTIGNDLDILDIWRTAKREKEERNKQNMTEIDELF